MNNNTLSKFVTFTVGAALGSAVTWFLLKEKYAKLAEEEIESVRELYSINQNEEPRDDDGTVEIDHDSNDEIEEVEELVQELGYINYSNTNKPVKEVGNVKRPYIIEPGEFDTLDDYDVKTLTYYSNDVVTDDYNNVIDNSDLDDMIGLDALSHFDENAGDEDSVYVRNDVLRCDYEILRDYSDYEDE